MTKEFSKECTKVKKINYFFIPFSHQKQHQLCSVLKVHWNSFSKKNTQSLERVNQEKKGVSKKKKKKITTQHHFSDHIELSQLKSAFRNTRGISSHHEQNLLNITHFPTYHLLSATTSERIFAQEKKRRAKASDTINICVEYTIIFFFAALYYILPHECVARTKILLHVWESFITFRKFKPP